jgi:hypothetical protein
VPLHHVPIHHVPIHHVIRQQIRDTCPPADVRQV